MPVSSIIIIIIIIIRSWDAGSPISSRRSDRPPIFSRRSQSLCSDTMQSFFTTAFHQLTPGSPAARIGLRSGDEIVEIASTPTSSLTYQQALDLIASHNDTLLMTVERKVTGYIPTIQHGPVVNIIIIIIGLRAPKVLHILRCSPSDSVSHPSLQMFDSLLRSALQRICN